MGGEDGAASTSAASDGEQHPPQPRVHAPPASHALFTLLNQCVMEPGNPLLREWGLLGVRNLCETSPGVVAAIGATKAVKTAAAPELSALGVGARGRA